MSKTVIDRKFAVQTEESDPYVEIFIEARNTWFVPK
jgi:hypothetical protein